MRHTYVRRLRTNLVQPVAAPKSLAALGVSLVLIMSACASGPAETGSGAPTEPIASPTPVVIATTGPTSLVVPTTDPSSTATAVPPSTAIPENTATPGPAASSTPLATAALTATTRPIPTAQATAQPTATQPTATPRPATATAVPPTPTPTSTWVNPDCFVGPGAADEPVWWCGGKICVVGSPHYGCPTTVPGQPYVLIDCTISDSDIEVNEIITLTAVQTPADAPVRYAFSHGDGTIDNTSVSRAFYEAPGSYHSHAAVAVQRRQGKQILRDRACPTGQCADTHRHAHTGRGADRLQHLASAACRSERDADLHRLSEPSQRARHLRV